ncbi:MAG: hypothetical protein JWN37_304 [Candidatus Nomurabacteria bacterium]|nr:hypothetical protein [Candidatus Nomurabacteria bacterium]
MKKILLLPLLITSLFIFVQVSIASAQTPASSTTPSTACSSVSGDCLCGGSAATKCDPIADAATIINRVYAGYVLPLGTAFLVVYIIFRYIQAFWAWNAGNSGAFKTATSRAGNATLGFIIIILLISGFYIFVLRYIGVQEPALQLLRRFAEGFIPHAYAAADGTLLPNPVATTNISDFLMGVLRLSISYFFYPAVIAMWVWTGFTYVAAQGNPESLKKSHKRLFLSLVVTLIVLMTQGFLVALRNTVQQSLPAQSSTQGVVNQGSTNPTVSNGTVGTTGTAGKPSAAATGKTNTGGSTASKAVSQGALNTLQAAAKKLLQQRTQNTNIPMPTDYSSCISEGHGTSLCAETFPDTAPADAAIPTDYTSCRLTGDIDSATCAQDFPESAPSTVYDYNAPQDNVTEVTTQADPDPTPASDPAPESVPEPGVNDNVAGTNQWWDVTNSCPNDETYLQCVG